MEACTLLSAIREDRNDLTKLLKLQKLLISEIYLAEKRVRENKQKEQIVNGDKSKRLRARTKEFQQIIYYWKTFGDAIAFMYIDRFALKHVYYNIQNLYPKATAGFLSGSAGFSHELKVTEFLINNGNPCVLTDLTNTIRYGDVCVLHGPDPVLIEVKASKSKDRRRTRQRQSLRQLMEFYKTDRLDGLQGLPHVRRIRVSEPKSFAKEFNKCIAEAYRYGHAVASPEEGVYYITVVNHEVTPDIIFAPIRARARKPWLFFLNETKSNCAWAPYYPFTLLIETPTALYDFIVGRLTIVVVLDIAVIKRQFIEEGYTVEIVPESRIPFRIDRPNTDAVVGISEHYVKRVALEAVSLQGIVQGELLKATEKEMTPEDLFSVPMSGATKTTSHKIILDELMKWKARRHNK